MSGARFSAASGRKRAANPRPHRTRKYDTGLSKFHDPRLFFLGLFQYCEEAMPDQLESPGLPRGANRPEPSVTPPAKTFPQARPRAAARDSTPTASKVRAKRNNGPRHR